VGENGVARPDGTARSLIRTQARRRGKRLCRRDRHPSRTELIDIRSKAESQVTSSCDSPQDFSTSSTSSSSYLKSRSERSSLSQSVSSDAFDPFDTLPISGNIGNTPKLIRHCEFCLHNNPQMLLQLGTLPLTTLELTELSDRSNATLLKYKQIIKYFSQPKLQDPSKMRSSATPCPTLHCFIRY